MELTQRLKKWFLVAGLTALSGTAFAVDGSAGLDISLSNETGNIGLYSLRETPQELTNLGVDYFFNQPGDYFVDVFGSISRKGMGGNQNLELGVKGKVFYVSQKKDKKTGQGLMLGVTGRYWLPTEMPAAIAADFIYAPPIVSFGDAENAHEFNVRGELRILPSAVAYIGFRQLAVDFPTRYHELDKNVHIGVRIAFQ